jgi:hypothetical protein
MGVERCFPVCRNLLPVNSNSFPVLSLGNWLANMAKQQWVGGRSTRPKPVFPGIFPSNRELGTGPLRFEAAVFGLRHGGLRGSSRRLRPGGRLPAPPEFVAATMSSAAADPDVRRRRYCGRMVPRGPICVRMTAVHPTPASVKPRELVSAARARGEPRWCDARLTRGGRSPKWRLRWTAEPRLPAILDRT